MKRKVFSVLAVCLFAFAVLSVSTYRSTEPVRQSYAAATLKFEVLPAEGSSDSAETKKVEYYLAYPGILPDHSLYKLKMIRDRVLLWLAFDPLKKAEKQILMADKRLGAGIALVEGNKVSLGLETLLKGEKYLDEAVSSLLAASQKGEDISSLAEKISNSSLKHREVLLRVKEKTNEQGKVVLEEILKVLEETRNKINAI